MRTLTILAIVALCACSKTPAGAATASAAAAGPQASTTPPAGALLGAEPAKPVPAQLPDVLARVNGEAVNKTEFDRAVAALEARNGGPVPAQQRDRVLREVLGQIVDYKLLIQESRARKIDAVDTEVDARIKEIQGQFPSEDAFKQMLTARKTTLDQLRSDIRQDITVQKLLENAIADKVAVKPEQVTDFYAKNPDQFKQPERVRASHILITIAKEGGAGARTGAGGEAAGGVEGVGGGGGLGGLARR